MEKIKSTNVEKMAFVPIVSSVVAEGSQIMPERFTSVSSPTGLPVATPEFCTVSAVQPASQKSSESR
jgi:hypothetical protein